MHDNVDITSEPLEIYMAKEDILTKEEEDMIAIWNTRSFMSQMIDVWGEVDKLSDFSKSKSDIDKLIKQIKLVSKLCRVVRNCPNNTDGEKYDIKMAEWELYDYYFGDNIFNNDSPEMAANWFNQWCYDINYDLLN